MERRQLGRSQSPAEGLVTKLTNEWILEGAKNASRSLLLLVLGCVVPAGAQPAVTATLSNVTRIESWSYFRPTIDPLALTQAPIGDPDYTFIGDRAELGVRVDGSRWDFAGAFNYVRLENLPTNAIGPGGFGSGAFYFAATGVRYSYQLYLGELTARLTTGGTSVTFGRMPFASGAESPSATASLQTLKADRLHSRLIGNFEWSYYQRRFDGARLDVERPRWHFTASAFVPTQGGYEESTNLSMPKLQLATASWTQKANNTDWQVFAYGYRDRRGEMAVPDNTLSFDRSVDVTVATAGASYARISPTRAGELDAVAWAAVQAGDWYGRDHRAASVALEAGHRWTSAALRPWLRAGYSWASGDGDGDDNRHGTYFQMLPSSQKYGLSAAYAQMNLSDAFAQLRIEPYGTRARIEVHALRLASGADLWYHGSGATASRGRFFGFSGRPALGHTALGTVIEGAIDVPIRRHWSINAYAGTMSSGAAVQQWFTDKRLLFWSVENVVRFP